MKGISVVIPVYNEAENVADCYHEIRQVLNNIQRQRGFEYEVIFVDDGSVDETIKNLLKVAGDDDHLKIIEFRRNFGQTAAMAAGLENSIYDIVVTLDGDLQNDPSEIPKMIEKLECGYDLVAGWRKNRQDKFISRKFPSILANWLISVSTKVKLHDYGCTLKVMSGEVARNIRLYGEMHRFIPALANEFGAKVVEVPVNHRPRQRGVSKYGISRTFRVLLDLITVKFLLGFSKRPIHLFGGLGLLSGLGGFGLLCLMTLQRFLYSQPMGNRPLLMLAVMLVLVGIQFMVFGLLAEVLVRTYHESQGKRIYAIRRVIRPGTAVEEIATRREDLRSRKVAN